MRERERERETERERMRDRKSEDFIAFFFNASRMNEGKLAAPFQRKGRMFSHKTIPKINFSFTCTESYQIAAIFRKGSF